MHREPSFLHVSHSNDGNNENDENDDPLQTNDNTPDNNDNTDIIKTSFDRPRLIDHPAQYRRSSQLRFADEVFTKQDKGEDSTTLSDHIQFPDAMLQQQHILQQKIRHAPPVRQALEKTLGHNRDLIRQIHKKGLNDSRNLQSVANVDRTQNVTNINIDQDRFNNNLGDMNHLQPIKIDSSRRTSSAQFMNPAFDRKIDDKRFRRTESSKMYNHNSSSIYDDNIKTSGGGIEIQNNTINTTQTEKEIDIKLRKLIDEWYNFCEENSILHGICQTHFKKLGNTISISAIILSTLGGTSSLATSSDTDNSSRRIVSIVLGITSLVSGTLMTIHRYFNYNQLEKDHGFYSGEYAKIKNEMHMQIHIYQCDSKTYVNLVEFCKHIKRSLDSLLDRAPCIPSSIAKNFNENKVKNKMNSKYLPSLLIFNNKNMN